MKPPLVPIEVAETSEVPSGFVIETLRLQQVGPTLRLIRRPAVPAKVSLAFWPGTVVVAVTAAPPGVIVAAASAGAAGWWGGGGWGGQVEGRGGGGADRRALRVDEDRVGAGGRKRLRVDEAAARA